MVHEWSYRASRPASVVIFGHSFINHMEYEARRRKGNYHNMGLDFSVANVNYVWDGGLTISDAYYYYLDMVMAHQPDLVFIELGTCDIGKIKYTAGEVGKQLIRLAQELCYLGVKQVLLGKIIYRKHKGIPKKCPEINYKISDCNRYLCVQLDEEYSSNIKLWRHKGLWYARKNVYFRDGIHLNRLGNLRLYRSIRAGLLKSLWQLMDTI